MVIITSLSCGITTPTKRPLQVAPTVGMRDHDPLSAAFKEGFGRLDIIVANVDVDLLGADQPGAPPVRAISACHG